MKRLDAALRRVLETGCDALGYFTPRLSEEQLVEKLREPWRRFGKSVTRDFMRRHPGRRPWAWWQFDAPAPRPVAPAPDGIVWQTWEERDLFQAFLDETFLVVRGLLTAAEKEALDAQTVEYRRLAEEESNAQENIPDPGKVN